MAGPVIDVTECTLQESEERYRSIFDCINDAVFVLEVETGAILDVNQRACELFGHSKEAMRQLSIAQLSADVPPHTQKNVFRWMQRALQEGPQLFEWKARARSGDIFWVEVNMRTALIQCGTRLVLTVRDISKRKGIESELRKSEERFRLIMGNSRDKNTKFITLFYYIYTEGS